MNSWEKSDSERKYESAHDLSGGYFEIGPNDLKLAVKLAELGSVHAKFRRMITVYVDITAPLYFWKEFDTYKVGTVSNSCSTMHKIADKEFTLDDFSHEHLLGDEDLKWGDWIPLQNLESTILVLNSYREKYLKTKDKRYWWQLIQLLPSSYDQKRTIMMNYEVLNDIYKSRRDHKLDEWRNLCCWIENLPYSEVILC